MRFSISRVIYVKNLKTLFRRSEERVLEWMASPDKKRQTLPDITSTNRIKHDPVRNLLQIEFSPILPIYHLENSPSPIELDHKDIPLKAEDKESILNTPLNPKALAVREEIARRLREKTSTVSPLALRLNYLKLGGKILESPAWFQETSISKDEVCER